MTPDRRKYFFFFFNDTATTEIYTLSLHDALPISWWSTSAAAAPSSSSARPSRRWSSRDRKSTRLNSSHSQISYAVFCLKKKNLYFLFQRHCHRSPQERCVYLHLTEHRSHNEPAAH